jgi:Transcriptional activator TraM
MYARSCGRFFKPVDQPAFDVEALIAEVAKRHKILLAPEDPAFALVTLNELVLSHFLAIFDAKLERLECQTSRISAQQTETAKAIGENIITAGAAYVADRLKEACAGLAEIQGNVAAQPGEKQSACRRAGSNILLCAAAATAFAAGFFAASFL